VDVHRHLLRVVREIHEEPFAAPWKLTARGRAMGFKTELFVPRHLRNSQACSMAPRR
jgi:hypothetical protein